MQIKVFNKKCNAQCNLGICYDYGKGVRMNKAEAVKWFRMAAKQGCVEAQYSLNAIAT